MNQNTWEFFVLLTSSDVQLVNSGAVVRMVVSESAGAPLDSLDSPLGMQWPDPSMFALGLEGHA